MPSVNSNRSKPALRYRNPVICEHLASQYVTGVMTPRVRSRLETLLNVTPELNRAVAFWSDQMAEIQFELPEQTANDTVWNQIDVLTPEKKQGHSSTDRENQSWWKNLVLWQATGIAGIATSFALALMLFIAPLSTTNNATLSLKTAPSYMAAMSKHNDTSDNIRFVINAYKKTENTPSTLFVQWSQREPRKNSDTLFLWAEDKDTGELSYIGSEPAKGEPWHLTKPTWKAISNSSRLIATRDQQQPSQANTLFSGPCVQLTDWKQSAI